MKAAVGTPTGSRSGSGTVGSNARDRVVGERADGAAGEARHALGRLDAAARDEAADGGQRVGAPARLDRQVRGVGRDGHRPGLDPGDAVADLEEPPRADAEERVAAEALAALDRLEEVGRAAVVEAEEGADRRLEVGRPRRAQEDRVGVGGEALGLRQAERIGRWSSRVASRIKKRPFVPGRKVVPSAVPPSFGVCRTRRDRRVRRCRHRRPIGAALYRWRSAPEPTGVARLAPPRVRSGGSRVHSPSSSSRLAPAAGSLGRRATGTRPVHSPFFVMWPGVWPWPGRTRQASSAGRVASRARSPAQRRTGSAG